jgi:hypothetical protein
VGTQFSQPMLSDRARIMGRVPLDRPPRPPAGALTDAVRGAILRRLHEDFGLSAPDVLAVHTQAEYLAGTRSLLEDLERRYALPDGSIENAVARRIAAEEARTGFSYTPGVSSNPGAGFVLLELPETEFLTAIEHAIDAQKRYDRAEGATIEGFFRYADTALGAHGVPYRRVANDWRFEWIGDPKQHELTVEPGLLALADPRLAGPRAEFEEALRKRRAGTPKDLEDAVDEAAKSVESILKVLHDELGAMRPRNEQISSLFGTLVSAEVLPGYVDKLVAAAAGPRNQMASHGQGATVREVPEELAEASIAAAATAITLLAHYLP